MILFAISIWIYY